MSNICAPTATRVSAYVDSPRMLWLQIQLDKYATLDGALYTSTPISVSIDLTRDRIDERQTIDNAAGAMLQMSRKREQTHF